MCVVVAKHLKNTGWVLAKNRDQNYVATVSFLEEPDPKVGEIFVFDDHEIKYKEGMNHKGLVIITTSLTPIITQEDNKVDGMNIYKALHMSDPEEAAKFLISKKMTGYIFCATPDKLVLVEAAREDKGKLQGQGDYKYTMRVVPTTETVVRTNHGIDLPWAGFQYGHTKTQDLWRKSSETRMKIAERVTKNSESAEEMLDGLAKWVDDDLQLNVFRVESKPSDMRTIFQWALVPKKGLVVLRPIETRMDLKVSKQMITVRVLENQKIKKIYDGRIKHFTKLELSHDKKHIRAVRFEHFKTFGQFIK